MTNYRHWSNHFFNMTPVKNELPAQAVEKKKLSRRCLFYFSSDKKARDNTKKQKTKFQVVCEKKHKHIPEALWTNTHFLSIVVDGREEKAVRPDCTVERPLVSGLHC